MRVNRTYTITASGPINVVTGLNGTQMFLVGRAVAPLMCRSVFIQLAVGGTGYGIVLDGIYGVQSDGVSPRIPVKTASSDVTAQLAPASATAPGSSYGDPFVLPNGAAGIDVSKLWIDGSVPGDTVIVSYDTVGS